MWSYRNKINKIVNKMFLFLNLIVLLNVVFVVSVRYYMASKTSYTSSIEMDEDYFLLQNHTIPNQCKSHMNTLYVAAHIRHGSRYPKAKDTKRAEQILERMKNLSMPSDTLNLMSKIITEAKENPEKSLAPAGKQELKTIGQFFADTYSDHFKNIDAKDINITISSVQRTNDSYHGFIEGFQDTLKRSIFPTPIVDDALLRFFDKCLKYVKEIEENKTNLAVVDRFITKMHPELLKAFIKSTGLTNLTLDEKDVVSYYLISAIELALHNESNWAGFMDQRVINILEYVIDLKNYWKRGPAHKLSYEMSCVLISNLFHTFDDVISGKNKLKASFYFSHAETILPILNSFGMFMGDPPLTENNFEEMSDRFFRTTRMTPFATNVAFVLRHCPHEADEPVNFDDVYIELLFKGHPVEWPFCKNSICKYRDVRARLSKYIDRCNFDEMCKFKVNGGDGDSRGNVYTGSDSGGVVRAVDNSDSGIDGFSDEGVAERNYGDDDDDDDDDDDNNENIVTINHDNHIDL